MRFSTDVTDVCRQGPYPIGVFCVGPYTLSGLSGVLAYRVGWTNLSLLTSGYIGWWVGLTFKVRVPTLTSTGPVGSGSTQICLTFDPCGWIFIFVFRVLFCFVPCVCGNDCRSEMIFFISWPNLSITAALSDLLCHLWSLRSRTLAWKFCFMSCVLSIKVRVMKSVYFAHALAYRSVWAMNTPCDPPSGMLPQRSGKLTILKGKSPRLSYRDVTISPFRTSSCRSK